ncbi:MAG: Hsp20/alpha crystallin family protein [Deltaproteobacteria bacterium]|nr:Hsp20/alpha crystallin family protein [Deltaproteobacteria bacterium]
MFGITSAFDNLWTLQRAMENAMHNDYFGLSTVADGSPSMNIFRDGENTLVTVELPGLNREDVKLEVKGKNLRLSGKRKIDFPEKASVHRRERSSYSFDRTVRLAHEVDESNIKAELKDGVLAVLLPPAEEHKPKSIAIS